MLHKAWNSKGEMPYCFPRSSIKFQGHTVLNITALTQIGRFWTIGRSQLSNPSDLPCSVLRYTVSVSESVSVSASVSVSVAPFTLNENSCQFSTLSYVHNCLARRQSVILYRDLQDSDGNGRPYQFFTVGGPIETERTLIWWHWIGDWHGNWCSLNTASNLIRKWLLFGHGDWYGHGDGHGDGHSVNVP